MTWDYLTDTCASTDEMLSDLADWLAAFPTEPFVKEAVGGAGLYTRSESVTLGSSTPAGAFTATTRCLSRNIDGTNVRYWLAHSETHGIYCRMSDGATAIDSVNPTFNALTSVSGGDHSRASHCYPVSGANKYWFFRSDDDYHVHVRFQRSNGSWQAFSLGYMEKSHPTEWVGGEYFAPQCARIEVVHWPVAVSSGGNPGFSRPLFGVSDATAPDASAVDYYSAAIYRVHYSGQKWGLSGISPGTNFPEATWFASNVCVYGGMKSKDVYFPDTTYENPVMSVSPNAWNGRSVGVPVDLYIYDVDTTETLLYLGSIKGIRFVGLGTMTAETVINNDWIVFPQTSNGGGDATASTGYVNSGNIGVAYYVPTLP